MQCIPCHAGGGLDDQPRTRLVRHCNSRTGTAVCMMRIPRLLGAVAFLCILSSCQDAVEPRSSSALLGRRNLDSLALALKQEGVRSFRNLSDSMLWDFVAGADSQAIVGIKDPTAATGVEKGVPVVSTASLLAGIAEITAAEGVELLRRDTLQPWIVVRFAAQTALERIRRLPSVDYLEPNRFYAYQNSSIPGCSQEPFPVEFPRTTLPEGDTLPFTYPWMRIDRAWGIANGEGVKIGLTDTKSDPHQWDIGPGYSSGLVSSRRISWDGDHSNPSCTHGTRTTGVLAAPRNGRHMVGVAWGADLFSVRSGDDVQPSPETATNAIRSAAMRFSNPILMAWGTGMYFESVSNEIDYWYFRRFTFVGAAGTFPCDIWSSNNVIFPAEKPEVIAVSPAEYNGNRPCSAGYGDALDMVAYHDQPTTGTDDLGGVMARVSGSSNAAAVVAGVVALMLQRTPTLGPSDVRDKLIATSACLRPGASPAWHRMVNAEAAVGGICIHRMAAVSGPSLLEFTDQTPDVQTVTFRVDPTSWSGGAGEVRYSWDWVGSPYTGNTRTYSVARPSGAEEEYLVAGVWVDDLGSTAYPLIFSTRLTIVNRSADPCWPDGCDPDPCEPPECYESMVLPQADTAASIARGRLPMRLRSRPMRRP